MSKLTVVCLRLARTWLAAELSAGILSLILLVAFLPLLVIELPEYLGVDVPAWAMAVDVLTVSTPLAVILGASAIRVPLELVHQ